MTDSSVSMRPTSTKVRHVKHQPEPVSTISRTSVNQQPEPIRQASPGTTHGACRPTVQAYRADLPCRRSPTSHTTRAAVESGCYPDRDRGWTPAREKWPDRSLRGRVREFAASSGFLL